MTQLQDLKYRIADAHRRRDELKATHNAVAFEALSDPAKKEVADKLLDDVTVVLREIVHLESALSGAEAQDRLAAERAKDEAHAALQAEAEDAITATRQCAVDLVEALFAFDEARAFYESAHAAQQRAVQRVYDSAGLSVNHVADMAGWHIVHLPQHVLSAIRDSKRVHHTWPNKEDLLKEIPNRAGRLRGFVRQQQRGQKVVDGVWGPAF